MVFDLSWVVFSFFFGLYCEFPQLFKPFGDDSQHAWGFHEKDSILNFIITIFRSVFGDLSTDKIARVTHHFFSVLCILIQSWFSRGCIRRIRTSVPLLLRNKYVFEDICHYLLEMIILFFCFINHEVDCVHNDGGIVLVIADLEFNLLLSCQLLYTLAAHHRN